MRVIFIRPPAPASAPFSTSEKRAPIGLASMMAVLKHAGHEVKLMDMYIGECCTGEKIDEFKPDYVGMYLDTICFNEALYALKSLNQIRKQTKKSFKIVVGGPHATLRPGDIPDFVDFIVKGEGEKAIINIIENDGCWKEGQKIIEMDYIEDLDKLPMPDYDELYRHNYDWTAPELDAKKIGIMNTSRGCPYRCRFCSAWKLWGKKYRWQSANRIIKEINYLKERHGIDGVYFREDNFISNKQRLEEFCKLMKEIGLPWKCEGRINNLTDDVIEMMAEAGCRAIYIGVESGSQQELGYMQKDIRIEDTKRVFRKLHKVGIKGYASMIVGFPVPDISRMEIYQRDSHRLLQEIKPYQIWYNIFTGLPGSDAYDTMTDYYEGEWGMRYPFYWDRLANNYYGQGIPWRVKEQRYKLRRKWQRMIK